MRNLLLLLAAVGLFLTYTAMTNYVYAEDDTVPQIEMVDGPQEPTGPYATNKGVQEFFKMTALETEGKLEEAKKAYTEFITRFKDQPVAIYYLAHIYLKLGDNDKTMELIKLADKTNPG